MRRHPLALATAAFICARFTAAQSLPSPDVDCTSLENPVFIEAGDTQMQVLGDVARHFRDLESPITLVYLPRSTCTLRDNMFGGIATTEVMRYVPSQSEVETWDGTPRQCNNQVGGIPIDIAIAATFISSCTEAARPDDIGVFRGPVQAYGYVTANGVVDSVKGITREEAYFVFSGQGAAANALPWTAEPNPAGGTPSLFIRRPTTSTLLTLAANVAPELLPASSWVGYHLDGQADRSSVVISGVTAAAGTALEQATLGLLGLDLYDRRRDTLDVLAYQAKDQRYGYYPDSTSTARDKRNVRDGHYLPWGYTEYLVKVNGSNVIENEQVQRVIDVLFGGKPVRLVSSSGIPDPFDKDALEVVATNGLVPECAMTVSRGYDGGDLSLYSPEEPCACFFEAVQDPTLFDSPPDDWAAKCPVCTTDGDCGDGACRRGFCEVH